MVKSNLDVCIVTSGSLSSGPRVVKEADALVAAGFSVHVVAVHTAKWVEDWDRRLSSEKSWSVSSIRMFAPTFAVLRAKTLNKLTTPFTRRLGIFGETSLSSSFSLLLGEAKRHPAKLYIAHNLAALPVAARAASSIGAKLAFDAEDDHLGELSEAESKSWRGKLVRSLESKYLPECAYVTAASEGIAKSLASRYGIPLPSSVHNVFSLALRQTLDGKQKERGSARLSIYWYSQTVGLKRGLQDLLVAAGTLEGSFEIHIRGYVSTEVKSELLKLVPKEELRKRIFFHDQVHPDELLSRTVEHDVGMALEPLSSPNGMSTVSNKLFFYFLGGLAVVATDTPGQAGVLRKVAGSGELYSFGDTEALAKILQKFHDDPAALSAAKEASRRVADSLWNWEKESAVLVTLVRNALK